jgi:hypothetical protein
MTRMLPFHQPADDTKPMLEWPESIAACSKSSVFKGFTVVALIYSHKPLCSFDLRNAPLQWFQGADLSSSNRDASDEPCLWIDRLRMYFDVNS